jgi:hypothetical protein
LTWQDIAKGFMFGNFVSIWDAHENESLMKNGIKMCRCLLVVPIYGPCGFITRIFGFSNREFWSKKPNWGGVKKTPCHFGQLNFNMSIVTGVVFLTHRIRII